MQNVKFDFDAKSIGFSGCDTLVSEIGEYGTSYAICATPYEKTAYQVIMMDEDYNPCDNFEANSMKEIEAWLYHRGVLIVKDFDYISFIQNSK